MVKNGDDKHRVECAEICKTIKKKAIDDIKIQPRDHKRNDHDIKEPEASPKNAEARPRQTDHTPRKAG